MEVKSFLEDIIAFAHGQLQREMVRATVSSVMVIGKLGARGRRGRSSCGHTMDLESSLPLASPFLLAPIYSVQSRVQQRD